MVVVGVETNLSDQLTTTLIKTVWHNNKHIYVYLVDLVMLGMYYLTCYSIFRHIRMGLSSKLFAVSAAFEA